MLVSLNALKPKKFSFELIDLPDLFDEITEKGRYYTTPEGEKYRSVTTFLKMNTDSSGIEKWRNWVGHEKADAIRDRAAERGTAVHGNLELYLKGEVLQGSQYFHLFTRYIPTLKIALDRITALETALWSDYMKLAGRVDCAGYWKGKLSIIDFKTSDKEKKEKNILNYFLQVTLYALMYYERVGILPENLVVLVAPEKKTHIQVFEKSVYDYIPKVEKLLGYPSKWTLDQGINKFIEA